MGRKNAKKEKHVRGLKKRKGRGRRKKPKKSSRKIRKRGLRSTRKRSSRKRRILTRRKSNGRRSLMTWKRRHSKPKLNEMLSLKRLLRKKQRLQIFPPFRIKKRRSC